MTEESTAMEDARTAYKIGAMEATVKSLQGDISEIKSDQKSQNAKLDILISELNTRKGGMAVLVSAAAGAGTLAALIIEWLKK